MNTDDARADEALVKLTHGVWCRNHPCDCPRGEVIAYVARLREENTALRAERDAAERERILASMLLGRKVREDLADLWMTRQERDLWRERAEQAERREKALLALHAPGGQRR